MLEGNVAAAVVNIFSLECNDKNHQHLLLGLARGGVIENASRHLTVSGHRDVRPAERSQSSPEVCFVWWYRVLYIS